MSLLDSARRYAALALRWHRGRRGAGHDKMRLLTAHWPLQFDT
ncbi:hypothetical protein [Ideonella sp.]